MAKKTCPACQNQLGPRSKTCPCGHVFITENIEEKTKSEPLQQDSVKKITITSVLQEKNPPKRYVSITRGTILAPAGECPIKPKGYKQGWPEGPATDEVVQNWAMDVFNYAEGRFSSEAVVYWARNFWDINGAEFRRIRSLIFEILSPETPESNSNEIVC